MIADKTIQADDKTASQQRQEAATDGNQTFEPTESGTNCCCSRCRCCCCFIDHKHYCYCNYTKAHSRVKSGQHEQAGAKTQTLAVMNKFSGRGTPRGTRRRSHSFIMFTLLNLILLLHALAHRKQLHLAHADGWGESMIKVTRFQVPAQVRPGELRRLTCLYELHEATLHALKLFKDDKEFYRFTPGEPPSEQKMTFPVVGVQVDFGRSNEREVWLRVNKRSSGQYKCQVIIEGKFTSVSAERRMEVTTGDGQSLDAGGQLAPGALGGRGWQQHPPTQQQDLTKTFPAKTRQHHSAVQQHPSQLYGLSSTGGGGGGSDSSGGPSSTNCSPPSLTIITMVSISVLLTALTSHGQLLNLSRPP